MSNSDGFAHAISLGLGHSYLYSSPRHSPLSHLYGSGGGGGGGGDGGGSGSGPNGWDADDFPCVLLGNKCDLPRDERVCLEDVLAWCLAKRPRRPITYLECSCSATAGNPLAIKDAFLALAERSRIKILDEVEAEENGEGLSESGTDDDSDDDGDYNYDEEGESGQSGSGSEEGDDSANRQVAGAGAGRARGGPHIVGGRDGGRDRTRDRGRDGIKLTPASAETCALLCLWGSES